MTEEAHTMAFVVCANAEADPPPSPLQVARTDGWLAIRLGQQEDFDCLFLSRSGPPERTLSLWGIEFTGRLLWIRVRDSQLVAFRWIDGCTLVVGASTVRSLSKPEPLVVAQASSSGLSVRRGDAANLVVQASLT
jgi:hypothetical protein